MANTITQRLGFDTSDAIANINAMSKALSGLNTKIRAFNKAASSASSGDKVAQGLNNVANAADKAGRKVAAANDKIAKSSTKGAKGVEKITFAWSGLAKALVARTAVQAITAITGAILDAADAASEFELSIARISNIAQGPGSSIAELEQSLSQLAVTLGRPQAEVAEAAFEALQNDLGSTTDTMQLLEGAANDLALVTGGTLTQAVNSLSSVLKAYDLPASKAGEITDLFFAAIDKGRISLKELESSLGKITPLAAQLDVDFANVAAAMAAITQSGTTAATANTQLRSIFQKLIRPTEQLQGAFNKLGVETFNQLIDRSDNLQDALQKIAGALDNDSQKIAEAFGRLRGQLGVFNLLANEGKIFQDTMEAVADSAGKAAEGAARIDSTDARAAQKAWAEFDEIMRQVGKTVLVIQTAFVKLFNTIVSNGDRAVKAIAAISASIATATVAMKVFGVTLATVAWPVAIAAATAVAIIEVVQAVDRLSGSWRDVAIEASKYDAKLAEIDQRRLSEGLREENDRIDEQLKNQVKMVESAVGNIDKAYVRLEGIARAREKDMLKTAEKAIDNFISGVDAMVKAIEDRIEAVGKRVEGMLKGVAKTAQRIKDLKFERDLEGLSDAEVAAKRATAAYKSLNDVRRALSKVDINNLQGEKQLAEAVANFRRKSDEAVAAARKTKDKEVIDAALDAQIKGEKKVKSLQLAAARKLHNQKLAFNEKEFKQQQAQFNELKRIAEELKGKTPGTSEYKDLKKQFQDQLGKLKPGFLEKWGASQELRNLVRDLGAALNDLEVRFPTAQAALQKQLDGKVFQAKVKFNLAETGNIDLDKRLSDAAKIENPAEALREGIKAANEFIKAYNTASTASVAASKQAELGVKQLNNALSGLVLDTQGGNVVAKAWNTMFNSTQIGAGNAFIERLRTFSKDLGTVTSENAQEMREEADNIETVARANEKAGSITAEQMQSIVDGVVAARKILDSKAEEWKQNAALDPETYSKAKAALADFETQAAAVELGLDPTNAENFATAIGSAATDSATLKDNAASSATSTGTTDTNMQGVSTSTSSAAGSAAQMASAYERAAKASQQIKPPAAPGGGKYFGGSIGYRAAGGPTRGMDTQLTATSPGEFITNARQSRN
ncbi:MAG: phage tail tape measure protein, partial [Planctomycetota bacterium]